MAATRAIRSHVMHAGFMNPDGERLHQHWDHAQKEGDELTTYCAGPRATGLVHCFSQASINFLD
jgi:hypothetical protein